MDDVLKMQHSASDGPSLLGVNPNTGRRRVGARVGRQYVVVSDWRPDGGLGHYYVGTPVPTEHYTHGQVWVSEVWRVPGRPWPTKEQK